MIKMVADGIAAGKDPKELAKSGVKPNLKKRGTVRAVVDGRYKFARYFSPLERHVVQSNDQLYANNDVELYDLKTDPQETKNLGAVKGVNTNLVMEMSAKLERVIKDEIGVDNGREMPDVGGKDIEWTLQKNLID
jgi:arylsulfatase